MAQAREQRAESRERRRSLASEPFEDLHETAKHEGSTLAASAKKTAATAAAAMLAGALAGAAKAMLDRRATESEADARDDRDESEDDQPQEAEDEHQEQPAAADETAEDDEDAADEESEQPAAEQQAPEDVGEDEPDQPEQPSAGADAEPDEQPSPEHEQNGARAGSRSDVARIVAQARDHLKNLLGADAESISGIERSNGNWSVTLEVVEMRRIPESTDILSSYTAVLDDDGGIVSVTRGRRYRRSQVEEG
jgi:gas vesicle protein GvpO